MTRGTSNGNCSGSSEDRRRRRVWLLDTYRADVDVWFAMTPFDMQFQVTRPASDAPWGEISIEDKYELSPWIKHLTPAFQKVCRCYRCGKLLTLETLTVDRIIPGCQGGTYKRNNIRPACGSCNSETGGKTRRRK